MVVKRKIAKIGLSRCNFPPVEVCSHLGKIKNKKKRYYYIEGFATVLGHKTKFFGFVEGLQLRQWKTGTKEHKEEIKARKDDIKEIERLYAGGKIDHIKYELETAAAEKVLANYVRITKITKKIEVFTWHDVIVQKYFGQIVDREKATTMLKDGKWEKLCKLIMPKVNDLEGNDSKYEIRV